MRKLAEPFEIQDYQLIPGTDLYAKTVRNAKYLLGIPAGSLLYTFRKNAGLDTGSARPLGGWESPDMWFRGQYSGHYLSACVKAAITLQKINPELSEALRLRAEEIVKGLKECQDALARTEAYPGYLAAVESSFLDDLEQLNFTGTFTVIYYNLHKIMCGLLDVWLFANNQTALDILEKMADYLCWRMKKLSPERIDAMLNTIWYREDNTTFHMEFGGMAEVLYRLCKVTGKKEHLWLAGCFDRKWFRDMLLGEKDLLGHYSLHANTEIPCVIGLAEAADILGDEEAKICVDHFMAFLENGHQLPHGGVSGRSAYTSPADYGGELFEFPYMYFKHTNLFSGESCCSHNLNVLTRKEFTWTADCHWAEEHEKRYVNTVLAQQHPVTGGFVYNLMLRQGSMKNHSADGFYCCCGTGVEYYAALAEGSFYHKGNTLWLTNYVPCNLDWKEQGVQVECRTIFPQNGHVTWTLHMEEEKELTIQVRTPLWTKKAETLSQIMVNGENVESRPGSFTEISRVWKDGDIIEAEYPFALYSERMPDRPEYVSLFYGPHLLVACTDEFARFEGTQEELLNSLRPAGMRMPCTFTTTLSGKKILYRPICDVVDEKFNGYTIVSKPVHFHVVDQVLIGDEISEAAHNLECSHSYIVETEYGTARYADYPGYIAYAFKTIPDKQMWLRCYYQDHGVFRLYPGEKMDFNQCFRFELSGNEAGEWEEFSVQTLNEQEGEPLTDIYYPLRIDDEKVHIRISGCPYEGEKRGTGKFYQKMEVGYFLF